MKTPAIIAGILLALLYLGACALYWREAAQPNLHLCPLCGEEAQR